MEPIIVALGCFFVLRGWERVCIFSWEQDYRIGVGQEFELRRGAVWMIILLESKWLELEVKLGKFGVDVMQIQTLCFWFSHADSTFSTHTPSHESSCWTSVCICVWLSKSACVFICIAIHEAVAWPAVMWPPTLTVLWITVSYLYIYMWVYLVGISML